MFQIPDSFFFFTPHWNKQTEWISYIGTYMWKHKGMFWRKIYKVVSFHGNWVRFIMVYLTMMHFAAILRADKHKPAAWKYKGGAVADFRTQLQSVTSPIAQTTPAAPGFCCRHDFVHKAEKRKSLFCRGFLNMQQGSVSKPVGGDSQRFFSAAAFISISVEVCGISCWFPLAGWTDFEMYFKICGLRCLMSILPSCKIISEAVSESASRSSWWYRLVCTLRLSVFCLSNLV